VVGPIAPTNKVYFLEIVRNKNWPVRPAVEWERRKGDGREE
jgi:hypothetical protein